MSDSEKLKKSAYFNCFSHQDKERRENTPDTPHYSTITENNQNHETTGDEILDYIARMLNQVSSISIGIEDVSKLSGYG